VLKKTFQKGRNIYEILTVHSLNNKFSIPFSVPHHLSPFTWVLSVPTELFLLFSIRLWSQSPSIRVFLRNRNLWWLASRVANFRRTTVRIGTTWCIEFEGDSR
jgi:hypothetical protein